MTAMISELANVSGDSARKAAEAIVAYETRFAAIDVKLERLDGPMTPVVWQLAILTAGVATLIIKASA